MSAVYALCLVQGLSIDRLSPIKIGTRAEVIEAAHRRYHVLRWPAVSGEDEYDEPENRRFTPDGTERAPWFVPRVNYAIVLVGILPKDKRRAAA